MKVLLVEDEKYTARALAEILKKNHYDVDSVYDGEAGYDYAMTDVYDVIILDVMLPKMDGLSVLKKLRDARIDAQIILLTARGEIEDKVKGLDMGADDYLPKPFHSAELLARIRALQRRRPELANGGAICFHDTCLTPHTLTLTCGDKEARLKPIEARLMELLIGRKNSIVSKDAMLEKVWGFETDAGDNHVETQISRLRKVLERLGSSTTIHTIRGAGYMLTKKKGETEDV